MDNPSEQISLVIDAGPDSDLEDLARVTQQLREELLDLDVEDVQVPRTEVAADHTKAGDVMTWGTLLVSLGGTVEVLPAVVGVVQEWLKRREQHSVTIEFATQHGIEKLQLSGASTDQVQLFIDQWFTRHARLDG